MSALGIYRKDPIHKTAELSATFNDKALIGSSPGANVVVADPRCSGIHALVEKKKNTLTLVDLGSQFGTYVGDRRVHETDISLLEEFRVGQNVFYIDEVKKRKTEVAETGQKLPVDNSAPRRGPNDKLELVTEKNVLEVTLFWGEKALEVQTFKEGSVITLGMQRESNFHVTFADSSLQQTPYPIATYDGGQVKLKLPVEASGIVWIGQETVSLDTLRHRDATHKEFSSLEVSLRIGDKAQIQFGELSLAFAFVKPPKHKNMRIIPQIDRTLMKTTGIVCGIALLLALIFALYEPPQKEVTLEDIPDHLKQVLYDAGIEEALKKQQSAIGQIAQTLEGGRARAEEGMASAKKSPAKPTEQKKAQETPTQVQNSDAPAPTLNMDAAFAVSESTEEVKNFDMTGDPSPGNTAAALVDGGFARGTKGLGAGGGGQSVGIGALKGYGTGGGMGAGDYGLGPTKGRSVKTAVNDEVVILGGLDPEVIAEIIRRYLSQIQNCYEQQLTLRPEIRGKVTASFIIGPNGSVKKVNIVESTLKDPPTEKCISERIAKWKFPEPKGGGTVGVKYPFLLMSNSGK